MSTQRTAGWFDFRGTIGRGSFFGRTLAAWLLPWLIFFWAVASGGSLWLFWAITVIAAIVITLAAYVDRIRDMGANPILVLLLFVPIAAFGLWVACVIVPTQQPTRY